MSERHKNCEDSYRSWLAKKRLYSHIFFGLHFAFILIIMLDALHNAGPYPDNTYWKLLTCGFLLAAITSISHAMIVWLGYGERIGFIDSHVTNHLGARNDARPYYLLLRSFESDDLYTIADRRFHKTPNPTTIITSGYDGHHMTTRINIIERIASAIRSEGMLVAIGGTFKLEHKHNLLVVECLDEEWMSNFRLLASGAKAIIVIPEISPGISSEINWIKSHNYFKKTLLLMPPVADTDPEVLKNETKQKRWSTLEQIFETYGIHLPQYDSRGRVFTIDENSCVLSEASLHGHIATEVLTKALVRVSPSADINSVSLKEIYQSLFLVRAETYDYKLADKVPGDDTFALFFRKTCLISTAASIILYVIHRVLSLSM